MNVYNVAARSEDGSLDTDWDIVARTNSEAISEARRELREDAERRGYKLPKRIRYNAHRIDY